MKVLARRADHSEEMIGWIRQQVEIPGDLSGFFALGYLFIQEDERMDFLTGRIKPMYFKYLAAAFGSALISSIYGVVDMAMVGRYQGPDGIRGGRDAAAAGESLCPAGKICGAELFVYSADGRVFAQRRESRACHQGGIVRRDL